MILSGKRQFRARGGGFPIQAPGARLADNASQPAKFSRAAILSVIRVGPDTAMSAGILLCQNVRTDPSMRIR